jgi:hypothetical protein
MPGSLEAGDKSFGVVDACQGRFSLEEMNEWMEQDSLVLFTTSKFYQVSAYQVHIMFISVAMQQLNERLTNEVHLSIKL